jgi:hypothetical protein
MRATVGLALVIGAANVHNVNLGAVRQIRMQPYELAGLHYPRHSVT